MKKSNIAAIILFLGFLISMALGYLLPKAEFSEMEKRYLAEPPSMSVQSLFSGKWGKEAETYLTDHVPGRNLFVGINAYLELWAGRQGLKDVWVAEGKLLEAPAACDESTVKKNMQFVNNFAQTVGQQVDVMIVPSAGWAAGVAGYDDQDTLEAVYQAAGPEVSIVSVEGIFENRPDLYYNTDHHWTSQGAYLAYETYMRILGKGYRPAENFTIATADNFQGSTYSRSALWLTPAEQMELWQGSENLTVSNGETEGTHSGIFYKENLEIADKYTVFLDGNHSIVRVKNPEKTGKLLVIRDSYGHCLGGFLAESYGEVVLVDLRYYRQAVSELVEQEGFDNILVCYSCANFLTDTNLMLLR